uniref:Uncharacterized protein n=1 Tax=Candidatus Kentrum sp. UNK TaxID=2126344 RepID=A0A450ZWD3_9GAMM|nr:MAG: hypothetical protein BECKUNK1418G_GA0071005_100214 [Candidatus Kentron sp. UNK]VFK68255.1 MAG: hypothetical protein BECKUNK1418H_GA0071006_100114 [Candidatus Kentron sp. UNK]
MGRFIGYLLGFSIVGIGTAWIAFVLLGWPALRWAQLGSGLILIAVGLAIFCHLQVTHRKIDAGPVWASTLSITLWVMLPLLFGSYTLQWVYPRATE